ncbi:MAG: class III signal peptide-containing protein [Candidatus Diapherotrites archaeon]
MDNRGQGALEYLLLIGGAVLIATIVLLIIIGSANQTDNIIDENLNTFKNNIGVHVIN